MVMGTDNEITPIVPAGEIYTCPACNYKDGFHVSFQMDGATKKGQIILICPNCHSRFSIGWPVTLD